MADYGIRFNGHHSSEFGLRILQGKQIGFPTKIKSLVSIPHSSNEYDFSSVVGVQAYSDRTVSIPFHIKKMDKESLYNEWTKIVNWLMGTDSKTPLYDDLMDEYYYMAEVREAPEFNELLTRGTLTVNFTCYPFRISKLREGNDIWDTFNFELDVAQPTSFNISGSETVKLINNGTNGIYPSIEADSTFTITVNGNVYEFGNGSTEAKTLILKPGNNQIEIEGNGNIAFEFYKEVI